MIARHLHQPEEIDVPRIAWRWKNFWPPMPSGARMIEQGRPRRCSIIHGPMVSK